MITSAVEASKTVKLACRGERGAVDGCNT
jgi:hypothetical protein